MVFLRAVVLCLHLVQGARATRLLRGSDEGDAGNDVLIADGFNNGLYVCPASALPTAPDLVSFRRATAATTC